MSWKSSEVPRSPAWVFSFTIYFRRDFKIRRTRSTDRCSSSLQCIQNILICLNHLYCSVLSCAVLSCVVRSVPSYGLLSHLFAVTITSGCWCLRVEFLSLLMGDLAQRNNKGRFCIAMFLLFTENRESTLIKNSQKSLPKKAQT